MESDRKKMLLELQKNMNICFNNIELFDVALTHSSYANQNQDVKYNERLEFLGDAVLELVISDYLFKKFENKNEGDLTKIRAQVVCENSLFAIAKKFNLGNYINMSKGEEITGGRERVSILSDCVEAIIAAFYLDKGLDEVKRFILRIFNENVRNAINDKIIFDYKTKLQEVLQKNGYTNIVYNLVKFEGPPHKRTFFVEVYANNNLLGKGIGTTKKDAEQNAANDALKKLGDNNE